MNSWKRAPLHWVLIVLVVATTLPEALGQRTRNSQIARRCNYTLDEVDSLVMLLEDIEQELSEDELEDEEGVMEPAASGPTTLCTREMNRMRNAIQQLQRSYQRLKQDIRTPREFELRKNRYRQQKQDLATKLTGLEASVSTQHRSEINKLKRKIQEVEKKLAESVNELEEHRQKNLATSINLVATAINNESTKSSMKRFEKLMTYSNDPYGEIVKRVTNDQKLLAFLKQVDFRYQPIAGYEALVDSMIQRGTLRGWVAIEVLKHIQCILLARDGQQQERAVKLLKKFKMNAQ